MSATLNAKEIRAKAAQWLQHRNFWTWGEEEQAAFEAWLAESPSHMTAYLRVRASWENAERLTALRDTRGIAPAPANRRRTLPLLMGVAAMGVVVVLVSYFAALMFVPRERTYATGIGGYRVVKLVDGSQVDLNTDTKLRVVIDTHERKVWLDKGEAYFQVKHNVERPFTVLAGAERVVDLGTKFTVRRDPHQFQLVVVEGKVQLKSDSGSGSPLLLARGDVATSAAGAAPQVKRSVSDIKKELGWREGVLIFENTTLADAAAELNRYNNEKIVITGADAEHLVIGGKFAKNDIGAFIELAQHVLGLHVEDRGDVTVISR
jgi:transmembrane sensor